MSKKSEEHPELTDQQLLFCREYVKDFNGTQAAIRAGYSEKTAAEQASRLLTNVKISEFLKQDVKGRHDRVKVEADDVLRELMRLGYSDIRAIFEDDGSIKHPKDWPEELARAIASIEVDELFDGVGKDRVKIGVTKKVKFWPKDRALEMLAKNKKLLTDKIEINDTSRLAEKMAKAKKRATG